MGKPADQKEPEKVSDHPAHHTALHVAKEVSICSPAKTALLLTTSPTARWVSATGGSDETVAPFEPRAAILPASTAAAWMAFSQTLGALDRAREA